MDYYPLLRETQVPSLPEGVLVLYEKEDVTEILDFIAFLNSYKIDYKKESNELPQLYVDGSCADPEKLFTRLSEVFPDGEGVMNTDIVTQILNADSLFFEEYMDYLEDLIVPDKEKWVEDQDNPLFPAYSMFLDIENEFFPLLEDMH